MRHWGERPSRSCPGLSAAFSSNKKIKIEAACLPYGALEPKVLIVSLICAGVKKLDDVAPQRERKMGSLDPRIWLPWAVLGLAWAALTVASVLLSQLWCPASKPRSVFATTTVRLRNVAQRKAMSISQASGVHKQHATPPSSFAERPLTPPPTDEKPFTQAHRVVALFKDT
jgi:hypothetical protein